MLSRVLYGGRSLIVLAGLATLIAYVIGGAIGLTSGYRRSMFDAVSMRVMDVLLAFPPILLLLVIATGAGANPVALVAGIVLVQVPGIARIIRTATANVSVRGYVEAAVARGEATPKILLKEILPNLWGIIVADGGPRLTVSILLVAAINYLGLGVRPPAADWALMISENQSGLTFQPWSVVAASPSHRDPDDRRQHLCRLDRVGPGSLGRRGGLASLAPPFMDASAVNSTGGLGGLAVEVRDLTVSLASGQAIVESVSLEVAAGQTLGIIGESGSGKTTLGLALLGYARPGAKITAGSVLIGAQEMLGKPEQEVRSLRGRTVGYVPQDPATALIPTLRVDEQISELQRIHLKQQDPVARSEVLQLVHLPSDRSFRRRYPHQLSGGQQQRLAIALALVSRPQVLVLDEPTTGLDVVTQEHILESIVQIQSETGVASPVCVPQSRRRCERRTSRRSRCTRDGSSRRVRRHPGSSGTHGIRMRRD